MWIEGIGTDIVDIDRIRNIILRKGQRFLERVFTGVELDYCLARKNPYPCLAARFAAKEAVLKALGTGLAGCRWTDIEIIRNGYAAPEIVLRGNAGKIAQMKGIIRVLISVSHGSDTAIAFAQVVKGGDTIESGNCPGDERD